MSQFFNSSKLMTYPIDLSKSSSMYLEFIRRKNFDQNQLTCTDHHHISNHPITERAKKWSRKVYAVFMMRIIDLDNLNINFQKCKNFSYKTLIPKVWFWMCTCKWIGPLLPIIMWSFSCHLFNNFIL